MHGERVIFANTVDSLYLRALGRELSGELRGRLAGLGLDLAQPLLPAYPHAVWVRCLDETCRALHPTLPLDEARRRLARRMIEGYAQTMMGGAVLALARVVGPMRALGRMTQNFRSGNNFTQARLTPLGPAEAELWFNEPEATEGFVEGVLEEGLSRAGAADVTVTRTRLGPDACSYRVRWGTAAGGNGGRPPA